jgi:hypothetical protein
MKRRSDWIRHTHLFRADEYECRFCGYKAEQPYIVCPGCDTEMEGEEYDPSWVDEAAMLDIILGDEDW